jgi:hypothetical protein
MKTLRETVTSETETSSCRLPFASLRCVVVAFADSVVTDEPETVREPDESSVVGSPLLRDSVSDDSAAVVVGDLVAGECGVLFGDDAVFEVGVVGVVVVCNGVGARDVVEKLGEVGPEANDAVVVDTIVAGAVFEVLDGVGYGVGNGVGADVRAVAVAIVVGIGVGTAI